MKFKKTLILFSLIITGTTIFICKAYNRETSFVKYGTTAIGIITKKEIVIAADSRLARLNKGEQNLIYDSRGCKVHKKDSLIFAVAGLLEYHGESLDINFANTIKEINSKKNTLLDKIKEAKYAIYDEFQLVAERIQIEDPEHFKENIKKNSVTVMFVMYENNVPSIGFLDIRVEQGSDKKIYLKDKIDIHPGIGTKLCIGHSEIIDSINLNDKFFFYKQSLSNSLMRIFQLQALKTPNEVNDTINIITIDPKGIAWFERHQECY